MCQTKTTHLKYSQCILEFENGSVSSFFGLFIFSYPVFMETWNLVFVKSLICIQVHVALPNPNCYLFHFITD